MAARSQHKLLAAGTRAPAFRLQRLDGGEVQLQDLLANGPVLVAFFKVNCPVCQLTFPFLERIHKAGGLAIYGISQNGAPDTHSFNREFGITFPMLLDSEDDDFPASNAYGISSVPTLYLIASDGKIARVIEGWSKRDIEQLGADSGFTVFHATDNVPALKAG